MTIAACLALLLVSQQPAATATLRGRVLDADGRPMAEATVVAIGTDGNFIGLAALTKADGSFEISGVPASRIVVRAQPRLQIATGQTRTPLVMHPPAYFPGTLERSEAWGIDVKAGETIELDINVPPVFIGSIKTTVSGPDGYTLDYLRVIRPESNQIKNVTLSAAGVGYADELREGRHVVTARGRAGDRILVASQIVEMTSGENAVALKLEPGARVRGRLFANGGDLPVNLSARVIATWTDRTIDLDPLARDAAYVGADRSFTIDGLFGTRRLHVEGLPDGWRVVTIRDGMSDVTSGLDLVPGSTTEVTIIVAPEARQGSREVVRLEPLPLVTGTSSIHGRVIDALTGKPIEGAEVRLVDTTREETREVTARSVRTQRLSRSATTRTGSDGGFGFDAIRDGTYGLAATHRMYVIGCLVPTPTILGCGGSITVVRDQRIDDANMSLNPGGMIRGRVLDKDGTPVRGAQVKPEFVPPTQGANSGTSDADGRFELTSVPAGQMLIRVEPPGSRPSWHRTMYYPGVHERDAAQNVTVEIGRTTEIEIRLREVPVATIRATLSGPDGFRVRKMTLVNPDTKMLINMHVSDEGVASATNLDEGRYVVSATATDGSQALAAYQLIIVGADEYNIPMYLEPTATVVGRVVVDRGGVPPLDGVTAEAHWVNGDLKLELTVPERVPVGPDGSFTISGLFGRRHLLLFGLPDAWRVAAVRAGRSDVTSGIDLIPGSTTEIEIVVSRR